MAGPEVSPRLILPRIGFLIDAPLMFPHFSPLLQQFAAHEADIVLHQPKNHPEMLIWAEQFGLPVRFAARLLQEGYGYQLLVSPHQTGQVPAPDWLVQPDSSQPLLKLLGWQNARLFYHMGIDSWALSDWNQLYDHFLCFGPYQAEQVARFSGQKHQVGYPRYDLLFQESPSARQQAIAATRKALNCRPDQPLLVWLTTVPGHFGCLELYTPFFGKLAEQLNLAVKPHPHSWSQQPEATARLKQYPFCQVIEAPFDNLELLRAADWVVSDYGGTAFSALYSNCQLLLLDHPERPPLHDSDSWLRQHLPHFNPQTIHQLPALLNQPKFWQAQAEKRQQLRQQLFANTYGHASQTAAQTLRQLFAQGQAQLQQGLI